jgi:hypothetical protein
MMSPYCGPPSFGDDFREPVMPRGRTSTGRRVARLAAAVVACALVAGCGGDDAPEQELSPADQARAEEINFNPADLPSGWSQGSGAAAAGEGGSVAVDRTIEECLSQEQKVSPVTADVSSEGFELGGLGVRSNVTFARSVASARSDLSSWKTERAMFCFKQAIQTVTRELAPVPTSVDQTTTTLYLADVRVEPLAGIARYGDDSVAWRATAALRTVSGGEVHVTSDLVVFAKGRVLVVASFVSSPAPFPADLQQTLMTTIAARA